LPGWSLQPIHFVSLHPAFPAFGLEPLKRLSQDFQYPQKVSASEEPEISEVELRSLENLKAHNLKGKHHN
jgi:hypothetical protein